MRTILWQALSLSIMMWRIWQPMLCGEVHYTNTMLLSFARFLRVTGNVSVLVERSQYAVGGEFRFSEKNMAMNSNQLNVEVKTGDAGKLLFSQQLALVGDDAGKKLGFALKQFCDGAQDISASANIDVVKQIADVAASVQIADNFVFSGSTAVAVADGKTCSVKANIVGNRPGRTDGNPAGAALSTADQCLQVQKCYEADVWSDSSNAFCQQLVKGVPLQWDYAFSRGYPYYNCYRYKMANKDQFQTAMNTRYGTSGCRFRVVRVASV